MKAVSRIDIIHALWKHYDQPDRVKVSNMITAEGLTRGEFRVLDQHHHHTHPTERASGEVCAIWPSCSAAIRFTVIETLIKEAVRVYPANQ